MKLPKLCSNVNHAFPWSRPVLFCFHLDFERNSKNNNDISKKIGRKKFQKNSIDEACSWFFIMVTFNFQRTWLWSANDKINKPGLQPVSKPVEQVSFGASTKQTDREDGWQVGVVWIPCHPYSKPQNWLWHVKYIFYVMLSSLLILCFCFNTCVWLWNKRRRAIELKDPHQSR